MSHAQLTQHVGIAVQVAGTQPGSGGRGCGRSHPHGIAARKVPRARFAKRETGHGGIADAMVGSDQPAIDREIVANESTLATAPQLLRLRAGAIGSAGGILEPR